jgi:hypothetical protein
MVVDPHPTYFFTHLFNLLNGLNFIRHCKSINAIHVKHNINLDLFEYVQLHKIQTVLVCVILITILTKTIMSKI